MSNAAMYLHVGLMKTATTTLQLHVFPNHEDITYLGGPEFVDEAFERAICDISKQDRLFYDQDFHISQIQHALAKAMSQRKPVLLSAESLSTPTVDRLTKIERLIGLFGEIKIIVSLRRPEDLLLSLYNETIKQLNPRTDRLATIDDWLEKQWSPQRATRPTRILDFTRLIQCYHSLVGEKNVCVLLFEDLKNEPAEYARRLSEFIGISSQRTLELLQVHNENKRMNQLDYIQHKFSSPLDFLGGTEMLKLFVPQPIKKLVKRSLSGTKQFSISDEWRMKIRDYCREENKDLANLIGSGPERYNYF